MKLKGELNTAAVLILAAIVMAGFVSTSVLASPGIIDSVGDNDVVIAPDEPTVPKKVKFLEVRGTSTISADPDKATVYMGIEVNRETAKEAQQEIANKMASIRTALYLKGVTEKDIETARYSVHQKYDWIRGERVNKGYTAVHMIKVKSTNINKIGELIDAASAAGANKIGQISFGLSDGKQEELKKQALVEAGKNAREQADAIALGLDIKITGIERISVDSYQPYPFYRDYGAYGMEALAAETAPTQIEPGEAQVRASVSVTFSFE